MIVKLQYVLSPLELIPTDTAGDITHINFFTNLPTSFTEYNRPLVIPRNARDLYTYESWFKPVVEVDPNESYKPQLLKFYATSELTNSLSNDTVMYYIGTSPTYISPTNNKSQIATQPLTGLTDKLTIPVKMTENGWEADYLVMQLYIKNNNFGFIPITLNYNFKFDIISV